MVIEIKGTGSHNKGAEMMLLTVLQQFERHKEVKFTVAPQECSCEYPFFARLGLYPKSSISYKGFPLGHLACVIPPRIRRRYGLILDREIDVVLDASGFAYSSYWGEHPTKLMAKQTGRWKKQQTKICLLPQAFGPFTTNKIRRNMRRIISNSDLIYARDRDSEVALRSLFDSDKIKLMPDFTSLFKGQTPAYFDRERHHICMVPNKRMIDKGACPKKYVELFARIIEFFRRHDCVPFWLIHGGSEDVELALRINTMLQPGIEMIYEENPYLVKGIIQQSVCLVGSRYHSLASAMYSGTVALGTGWGHKYRHLFSAFDFSQGLIDLDISENELYSKLDCILDQNKREKIGEVLKRRTQEQQSLSFRMFDEIKELIGLVK
jgi:polysaccharide pyruvyl transferase WcaK-like protein